MNAPVVFIHGITEIGGAERELLDILDRLPRRGFHPLVVCPGTGPLTKELVKRGVEVRFASMPAWQKLFAYPKRAAAVLALRMIITEVRPMLLHVNDIWWVPQTLRAAARVRIPIVAHVRQEIEPRKVRRYELDDVDLVLPVSCQIQQSLEKGGVLPERLQVLYSGVDISRVPVHDDGREVRRRFGIPADALVLGTVANLFARKGYGVMLRALPAILASFPDVHYLIVGSGDPAYETRLHAMVKELRLERRVHFAGFQDSVYPYLAAMDVYVHPALMEGFGIAVLEAMAMRKPVVATMTGGLPEIVQDGETGVLVPPNEPDLLARAIVGLLQDSTRRGSMGRSGRTRVESLFAVEAMMDRLSAAYGLLVRKEATRPCSVSV